MKPGVLGSREARDRGDLLGPGPGVRKTVSILFADLVDSSRLSLSLDPEALWNLLTRYFDEMSAIVQKHGGTVEKYIGDAIMAAAGGSPVAQGDGARGPRAAGETREMAPGPHPPL